MYNQHMNNTGWDPTKIVTHFTIVIQIMHFLFTPIHVSKTYKIKTSKQKHWLEKWQRVKSKTPILKQNKESRERCYNLCSTLFTFLSLCIMFSSDAVFWSISLQLFLRGMTLMRSLNGLTNRIIMQDVIKIKQNEKFDKEENIHC